MTEPQGHFFECNARRSQSLAECLAVVCSDGSWHTQVDEFLASLDATQWDEIALPGGPALLNAHFASFREHHVARESLNFLVLAHPIRRIVLVAHEACGYYARRNPRLSAERHLSLQRQHLRIALNNVRRWHPGIVAAAYLLRCEADGKCWVEGLS